MAITDFMESQRRWIRVTNWVMAILAFSGVSAAIIENRYTLGFQGGLRGVIVTWLNVVLLIWLGISTYFSRKLRCPRCDKRIDKALRDAGNPKTLRHCPLCNADYSEPMPPYRDPGLA
jgi:hypothetical protein